MSALVRRWSGTMVAALLAAAVLPLISLAPSHAAELTTVTGTVVDADSGAPLEDAYVTLYRWWQEDDGYWDYEAATSTDASGHFSFDVEPGVKYTVEASFDDHETRYLGNVDTRDEADSFTPAGVAGTTIPQIALPARQAEAPSLKVSVRDSVFDTAVAGARVVLRRGAAVVSDTLADDNGAVAVEGLASGTYQLTVSKSGYLAAPARAVAFNGVDTSVEVRLEPKSSCEPSQANASLTNMGFESGLSGWTTGAAPDGVEVTGADSFASPYEGSKMARLGQARTDESQDQPIGPNILCQDFVVTKPVENFAFNVFTYDYTGYDDFTFDAAVTSATGERLATYSQGAWGVPSDTSLKTSGWRGATVNLAGRVGQTVRLTIRAGGTRDNLYGFWAYLDSAEASQPPSAATTVREIHTQTGSVSTDPTTGQWTAAFPASSPSDLEITFDAACATPGQSPTDVALLVQGESFAATAVGGTVYRVTIPSAALTNAQVTKSVRCDGEPTLVDAIGRIVLYDPSGIVTDAVTGQPVQDASVTLYKVDGWTPRTTSGAVGANQCETNESKGAAPWSQAAPTSLGTAVNAASAEISPNVNPFRTNSQGYYGWDVAEGCWYVTVTAAGYQPAVSTVVGVPSEVTDLNLRLTPVASAPASTAPVKAASRLTVKARAGSRGKATLRVKLNLPGIGTRATRAKVTVFDGKKRVKKSIVVKRGQGTLVLSGLRKGKHTFVVTYAGSATHLTATAVAKVKIR